MYRPFDFPQKNGRGGEEKKVLSKQNGANGAVSNVPDSLNVIYRETIYTQQCIHPSRDPFITAKNTPKTRGSANFFFLPYIYSTEPTVTRF